MSLTFYQICPNPSNNFGPFLYWYRFRQRLAWCAARSRVNQIVIPMRDDLTAPPPLTHSIGISTSPEHGLTSAELLRGADKALYAAKAAGRNCIVKASVVAAASAFNQTTAINTYVI